MATIQERERFINEITEYAKRPIVEKLKKSITGYKNFLRTLQDYDSYERDAYNRSNSRDFKSWHYSQEGGGLYDRYLAYRNERKAEFLTTVMEQIVEIVDEATPETAESDDSVELEEGDDPDRD
jgi:hypothetical protein